jgi:hypothetical protein
MARLGRVDGEQVEVPDFYADCLQIEPLALDEEFIRCPADIAYWNERYSDALNAFLLAEAEYERLEGVLWIEYRERGRLAAESEEEQDVLPPDAPAPSSQSSSRVAKGSRRGEKGKRSKEPTVDDVKAAVKSDDKLWQARLRLIEAQVARERMRGRAQSVSARKDALQSIGAKIRAELGGDFVMREQHRGVREQDRQRRLDEVEPPA